MGGSKEVRDETLMVSQLRRTNTPRDDMSGQNHLAPAPATFDTTSKLTTNDALTYLKAVKVIFHDETEKYDEFIKVMKDFKSLRIGTNEVIIRVKKLFEGHWDLIMGFNTFLPKGYAIKPLEEKKPKYNEAIDLVYKIRDRFENDEYAYKSFIDILNMYRRRNKQIHEVYEEVATLFKNHQDLLKEFKHFLPVAPAISPPHHGYANQEFACQDEMKPAARHLHEKKLGRAYRPHTKCNSSTDCLDIEHDRKRKRSETERIRRVDTDKKDHEQDEDLEHGDLDNAHRTYKSSSKRLDYPIPGKMQQGADGSGTANIGMGVYTREFNFCEKVKEKVHPDTYHEFLKCLDMYSKEIIMRAELKNLVNDILGKYPEIMEGFNEFLLNCEDIDGFLEGLFNKRYSVKHVKIEDRERKREVVKRHKDHEWERNIAKERADKGTLQKATFFSNKEKYDPWKPISELDLSNCQSCTPSYRLLPKNYPIPQSHRTRLGKSVLNDDWVLVTSGSEDRSFKHMLKNQHEETLFVCEDDRFEMDLLLGLVSATTKRLEKLLETMQDPMTSKSPIHIEDHLTSSNLRCVERLYGDHGLDVMDALQKNANLGLPVILTRLKQKQEEWSRCHSDFNKVWAIIYAQNFHKSLDHQSFYFKRQDSKNLRTKSFLSEIKEINNKLKENDVLLAVAAHNRHPIMPNMEFEYGDVDIHEDLYQMIKYSSREVCTSSDQFDKVMKLWSNFLEPLLGVPNQSVVEDYQHVGCKSHAVDGTPGHTKLSHGAESILHDQAGSSRTGLANGHVTAKNGFHHAERCVRNYFDSPLEGRVRGSYHMLDEVTRAAVQTVPTEHLSDGNNDASRAEEAHTKANPENTSGTNGVSIRTIHFGNEKIVEPQAASENLPCSEVGHSGRSIASENDGISEYIRVSEDPASINNSKIEREEGELSPSIDFEEDNASTAKANDEDVGSDLQSNEISENASEPGEDVSISESGNDMGCSHEDHEEEDDAEHDNQDVKDVSEVEAKGMTKAHDFGGEITPLLDSEKFLNTAKPLARHVPATLHDKHDKSSQIFYGNDSFYVLLRLHQLLYERMLSAKTNSSAVQNKWTNSKDTKSPDLYAKFLSTLYDLLDGSIDNAKFEDDCRAIIGAQSYVLFTLDKLIYKFVKQLQAVASDEMSNKLLHLYLYENSRQTGRSFDIVYHENARALLHDENLYRFECFSQPSDVTRLSIQLMDYTHENSGVTAVSMDFSFSSSLYSYFLSSGSIRKGSSKGVFLRRNKHKYDSADENSTTCKAMKGIQVFNGLECQISFGSSKTQYVVDTEDSLFRVTKKRRHPSGDAIVNNQAHAGQVNNAKIQRFHSFMSSFQSRS